MSQISIDNLLLENQLETNFEAIIKALGFDLTDPNLTDTPRRMAKFYVDFFSYFDDNTNSVFPAPDTSQMTVVSFPFFSMCAHHFLPFFGTMSVGYIAENKVIGLSKIPRIAKVLCRKPQMQEALVYEVATEISKRVGAQHIGVIAKGTHMCCTMRGIETPAIMVSNALLGDMRTDEGVKQEFMSLIDL